MNAEELEREVLLRDSGELSPDRLAELERLLASEPGIREAADQFSAFNRKLIQNEGADVPALDELTRARILREAGKKSRIPGQWPFAAAAAALALFLVATPALRREPVENNAAPHFADQRSDPDAVQALDPDPFLTELDLLDLQLLELMETAWFDLNGATPHLWDERDLYPLHPEDSI